VEAYKAEHGDCNVPQGWASDPALGNWVSAQRYSKKRLDRGDPRPGMTAARVAKLDELGFEWEPGRWTGHKARLATGVVTEADPQFFEKHKQPNQWTKKCVHRRGPCFDMHTSCLSMCRWSKERQADRKQPVATALRRAKSIAYNGPGCAAHIVSASFRSPFTSSPHTAACDHR
jgi:hypothetical protein